MLPLAALVTTSRTVAATSSRKAKAEAIAAALRQLGPDEVVPGVAYLMGELRQRRIGVGWASLRDLPAPAAEPSLTVADVDAACEALEGISRTEPRREVLAALFARATVEEQAFLRALLGGELRQGALAGVMADAIAKATGLPRKAVDRAAMLRGDLRVVAATALRGEDLGQFVLTVGRPVGPMLASPAKSVEDALGVTGEAAVETKLDGARVQVHRDGTDVAVFTRSLDDVTAKVPDVVAAALAVDARAFVLDGEGIALREDGRPEPFQVTGSRIASGTPGVTPVFFDVLLHDGDVLLDAPFRERLARLDALGTTTAARTITADLGEAQAAFGDALARGHEGVIVKDLDAPYAAGRRGRSWLKVKPRHTLDLVVLAAEWGHGRRRGKLSNLWLGTREGTMLGKTFKGLTDEMLAWQTERLLELKTGQERHVVHVRPELVVEIAFDGLQSSTRYPGGVALRFARVLRHRPDKPAADADTLTTVLALQR